MQKFTKKLQSKIGDDSIRLRFHLLYRVNSKRDSALQLSCASWLTTKAVPRTAKQQPRRQRQQPDKASLVLVADLDPELIDSRPSPRLSISDTMKKPTTMW